MTTNNRHDFDSKVKAAVRKQCGYICNNPSCRKFLWDPKSQTSAGVVSHIIAASQNGPRASRQHSIDKKYISSFKNALFLCSNCDRLVDGNPNLYPVQLLEQWKKEAESLHMSFLNQTLEYGEIRRQNRTMETELALSKAKLKDAEERVQLQQEYMGKLIKHCNQVTPARKTLTFFIRTNQQS